MSKDKISFTENGKQYCFTVEHNLNDYGLSIDAALDNWLARTKSYKARGFCNYVMSKDPINIICKEVK